MENKIMKQITAGAAIWEQDVVIPTYGLGKPDKNPMFLEKRVYQGSSGKVYPHQVTDILTDQKEDQSYHAICMENPYLFIMILPELGGRIQRAYDKTNGYDFVYYNQVIKPAMVGLTGPWISGGIEFNWPQHHRPSTYDPIDFAVEENSDGSITAIVSEIENMFRTKGMAKFTLYPDRAYLQIDAQIYNRTDQPQTFLWWANPAVAANDDTQSIFPPDIHAVMDHGKRDVSKFPIATGVYYKHDYSVGVDISRYKNIPVPTSYMAYRSDYDFIGGYDHKLKAGILHIADHHISPGKKQWTWGCGDFGKAWDRNLTDEDGPYIELMTGCFTDNQPDFSWLAPGEEKTFTQYFLPYRQIGAVKNANLRAALNLDVEPGKITVQLYVPQAIWNGTLTVRTDASALFEEILSLNPTESFAREIRTDAELRAEEVEAVLSDADGREILRYRPAAKKIEEIPTPAVAIPEPESVRTNEDLFLYGTHLEQYRHATFLPDDYYLEGLKRDPSDVRINNAYGLLLLRRGQFKQAESFFRAAIRKLTRSNPNPYDGEPFFNLGICLKYLKKTDEAFDSFYKATWNAAWQDSSFFQLARISAEKKDFATAFDFVGRALVRNAHQMKALALRTALLRVLGRTEAAILSAEESLRIDPRDFASMYELSLLKGAPDVRNVFESVIRSNPNWAIELALDYMAAGFYREASEVLEIHKGEKNADRVYPMVDYHLAEIYDRLGESEKAAQSRIKASVALSEGCFPHRLEDISALISAATDSTDAKAPYYLGCLWYDKRQYAEAIRCWERSRALDPLFPTVHRNLALAYYNKQNRVEDALSEMRTAYELDPDDARVLLELDQICRRIGVAPETRLDFLERCRETIGKRDDLFIEYLTLLNWAGRYEETLRLIEKRNFHPWEGGEGKVPAQYIRALIELAKCDLQSSNAEVAIRRLEKTFIYPENLGEGKLSGAQENEQNYFLGKAWELAGNRDKSRAYFEKASFGLTEPVGMMVYNDQPPETIFYQGLALDALGESDKALGRYNKLIDYGEKHIFDTVKIDYFAVSLPDLTIFEDDLQKRNQVHCLFMTALGYIGKGASSTARELLSQVLAIEPFHFGAHIHRKMVE